MKVCGGCKPSTANTWLSTSTCTVSKLVSVMM
ncbi:MAG TPA: hypothetical protein DCF88_11345 [Plesiomonas shigelloides]|nr:hypothetical protein [Plesiomonas shigelloides]